MESLQAQLLLQHFSALTFRPRWNELCRNEKSRVKQTFSNFQNNLMWETGWDGLSRHRATVVMSHGATLMWHHAVVILQQCQGKGLFHNGWLGALACQKSPCRAEWGFGSALIWSNSLNSFHGWSPSQIMTLFAEEDIWLLSVDLGDSTGSLAWLLKQCYGCHCRQVYARMYTCVCLWSPQCPKAWTHSNKVTANYKHVLRCNFPFCLLLDTVSWP